MTKALYARVSLDEQAIRGFSIEEQIEQCMDKAGTRDMLKYVDEGWTGEIIERPEMNKLREDAKNGLITEIYMYDPDRMARNLMGQLILDDEFKKLGIPVHFVNGEYANTPEGQMFFQMRGAISQFEKAKIKQRTMGGKKRKAMKGLVVKNDKIYGYTFNRDKKKYELHPEHSQVVKQIFDWYTSGKFKGVNSLAHHLTEIGIPTARGNKTWHRQVVKQILTQEAYAGTFYQNKWDTEGHYVKKQAGEKVTHKLRPKEEWFPVEVPQIVDKEQFEHAQIMLGEAKRRSSGFSRHNYLLSGLVRCGRCGGTMNGRKANSHGKPFFIYQCRKSYAGAKEKGCGKQISENKLNNAVWDYIKDLFDNPDKIKEYNETKENKQYILKELERIEKEIEKNKKGRKRLISLAALDEDGELDLTEIKDQIKTFQNKEKELQEYYKQIQEELKADENINENLLEKAIEEYLRVGEFTFEEKQHILKMCVKEVIVTEEGEAHIYLF